MIVSIGVLFSRALEVEAALVEWGPYLDTSIPLPTMTVLSHLPSVALVIAACGLT